MSKFISRTLSSFGDLIVENGDEGELFYSLASQKAPWAGARKGRNWELCLVDAQKP